MHALEIGYYILVQRKYTTQVYNIIFLNYVLLEYTKNVCNQCEFSNVT